MADQCEHSRAWGDLCLFECIAVWKCKVGVDDGHESLVLKEGTTRQFFRLVTGEVCAWFTAHNTPNPLSELLLGDTSLEKDVKIIAETRRNYCVSLN